MCQFIYSPTEGHLGGFQVLEIMNKAAMNIRVQVFVWDYKFLTPLSKYQDCDCWVIWQEYI